MRSSSAVISGAKRATISPFYLPRIFQNSIKLQVDCLALNHNQLNLSTKDLHQYVQGLLELVFDRVDVCHRQQQRFLQIKGNEHRNLMNRIAEFHHYCQVLALRSYLLENLRFLNLDLSSLGTVFQTFILGS